MPLSIEEAHAVISGEEHPLHQARSYADDEHHDVLPVSMYATGEGRVHGLLLARNARIEHPVDVTYNEAEPELMSDLTVRTWKDTADSP